jgi:WhiB family redox-sensing transcriptional regulator
LFFPVGGSGPALAQIATAKAVYARYPVREACLRYAVTTGQAYGIWGGLTEDERRSLRYRDWPAGLPGGRGATLASTSAGTARSAEANPSQN